MLRKQIIPIMSRIKLIRPKVKFRKLSVQPPAVILHQNSTPKLKEIKPALYSYTDRTDMCGALRAQDVSRQVKIYGWVQHQRMGGEFIVLRDAVGTVQVVVPRDHPIHASLSQLSLESVLCVEGRVESRPTGQNNKDMSTGDVEVVADKVTVLNTCRSMLPFQIHDFHEKKESLRLQYRYLDLRNARLQYNLRLRSQMTFKMRDFLCRLHGFVDVETPTLFRRTPGGAREFVVPTHEPGCFYSLPQSPQQFKQLLMVGGIDRYMQIARCYRDEGAKPDRQPEFTQLDIEMSFVTQNDIMNLIEGLLAHCWPGKVILDKASNDQHAVEVNGEKDSADNSGALKTADVVPSIRLPFPRLRYADAIRLYGTDKPDTRYGNLLHDITDLLTDCVFEPLAKADSIQAVSFAESAASRITNKDINELTESMKRDGLRFASIVRVKPDGLWSGSLGGRIGLAAVENISRELRVKPGDLFALAAGKREEAQIAAGRFRTEVAGRLASRGFNPDGAEINFVEGGGCPSRRTMNFLWIEEFPLFLPKEGGGAEGSLEAAHHPFTAPNPEDVDLVRTDPRRVRGQHYDLVLNGAEVGGGSIRIHNASLQRYVLKDVLGENDADESLQHLLEALDSGCPPHGGIALGLDRLIAMICDATSIRDVIAFPKSSEGRCLMSRAPARVSSSELSYYHLKVNERPAS